MNSQSDSSRKPVYFFDEGRFGLQSSLCRKWAKKGVPCTGKVRQSYQNFYVYSAVAPGDGDSFHLLLPFVNTEMMQTYLDEFSQSLGEKEIILIMDQAGWHKSKDLVIPKNIDIWFLPPYSPELNPVERLWKTIKKNTLHNRLYDTLKQLEKAVVDYFDTLTQEVVRQLCTCSYI
ncbi:MAG TPA: IS630 family transposase [Bacteroidales bacterium]|nr:IS630 family transposase [Bacteroidales bacterium]